MNGAQQFGQGAQGAMPPGMPPGGMGRPPGAFGFLPGGPIASMIILGLFVVTLIVLAVAFFKLFQKAGFAGALGLLMLIPVVNLGVALYLAFAEWPVIGELTQAKLVAASATSPPSDAVTPETVASDPPADPGLPVGT